MRLFISIDEDVLGTVMLNKIVAFLVLIVGYSFINQCRDQLIEISIFLTHQIEKYV